MIEMSVLEYVESGGIAVTRHERPSAGTGEVLVQVRVCGICGSEIHGVRTRDPLRSPPIIMGHEFAGIRSDTNERIAVNPLLSCGSCRACGDNRENLCPSRQLIGVHRPGGYAEYVAVPASALHRLPDDVTWEAAALVEPLANAVHGWRLVSSYFDGDSVAIIGAGGIGLMALLVLRNKRPDVAVHVTDLDPRRLAVAKRLGATSTATELTDSFELVIEAVGSRTTRRTALDALRPGGTALWYGLHDAEPGFDALRLVRQEQRVVGSFAYTQADFSAAVELAASVDASWLTLMDVEAAAAAFTDLVSGTSTAARVVIAFPHAGPEAQ